MSFQNVSSAGGVPSNGTNDCEMALLSPTKSGDVEEEEEEKEEEEEVVGKGKDRKSFELCHMIYDSTSFLITFALTLTGAWFIDAKIDHKLFVIVISEMQLFGLLLKSTYYLHVHPWEKLNKRHGIFVKLHAFFAVAFIVGFFTTIYCYGVTSIKILSICILVLLLPIGSVSINQFNQIL